VETKGKRKGVTEEIVSDSSREPLPNGLNVERLNPLQGQSQQHRDQEQTHDRLDRLRDRQSRKPWKAWLAAQNTDRLTNQQGLDRPCQCKWHEQSEGDEETTPIAGQIATKTPNAFPISSSSH
jgi:hypothetical protein